jgi:hypothetical protein
MFKGLITVIYSAENTDHVAPHSVRTLLGCKVSEFTTQNKNYVTPDLNPHDTHIVTTIKCDGCVMVIYHTTSSAEDMSVQKFDSLMFWIGLVI